MGADLLFAINEIKNTRKEAQVKASLLVNDDVLEDTIIRLVSHCGRTEFDRDDVERHEVLQFLDECIDTVYGSQNSRTCGWFTIDENRTFYITAGLSWGDTPTDEYDAFWVCQEFELTV